MNAVPSAGGYVLAFKLALTGIFPVTTGLAYKNLFALATAALARWAFDSSPQQCVYAHAQVCACTC